MRRGRRRRLPRTRRAEPYATISARGTVPVAPHTQSGTYRQLSQQPFVPGCPAHAERNLVRYWYDAIGPGLPRTRRAEPPSGQGSKCRPSVAPHTQSGTMEWSPATMRQAGCPAHAERNLLTIIQRAEVERLPRTRRAEPRYESGQPGNPPVAPHTQGGTALAQVRQLPLQGCPAHAGRNPSAPFQTSRRTRLPRTRRAEPTRQPPASLPSPVAPHTQGGTRRPV